MVELTQAAIVVPTLVIAYVIFGIAGFGTALVAAPILAHAMPVASIVPLLALLDFAAALAGSLRLSDKIAAPELFWLAPLMVIGSVAGVTLLISLPAPHMMLLLGIFVAAYGAYGLFARIPPGKIGRGWVGLFGPIGGLFSAMFGSGGFLYAIYLSRRLDDKDAIRATQATLIGLSTLTRVVLFLIAGIYADLQLLVLATVSLPAVAIGLYVGHRITLALSRDAFLRLLHILLIASGGSLILRFVNG